MPEVQGRLVISEEGNAENFDRNAENFDRNARGNRSAENQRRDK
jgi:hypothetical protein